MLCLYVTLTLSADEGTCYGDKDKGCSREQSSGIFVTSTCSSSRCVTNMKELLNDVLCSKGTVGNAI